MQSYWHTFHLQVDYSLIGEVMKWIKENKHTYYSAVMSDTFSVKIDVPYSKQKEINDLFIERFWVKSVDLYNLQFISSIM